MAERITADVAERRAEAAKKKEQAARDAANKKKQPKKKTRKEKVTEVPSGTDTVDQTTDAYTEYLRAAEQQQRVDAIEVLKNLYSQYGLSELADTIVSLKQQGYSDEVVEIRLQETPQWKTRFVGNEARRKAGLPVLSVGEYIATEAAYKKILKDAQLPTGFYDSPDDFSKFIGGDVAPTELQERVTIANLSLQNADPFFKESLQSMYGLTSNDMLAYTLDPERALPLITRQVKAAQFGAEARRQGITDLTTSMAETYTGQLGVSQEQARAGFEQIAMIQPEAERLSQIYRQEAPVGLEETTSAVFGGEQSAEYKRRLQRLSEMEQATFAGQSGIGAGSLARQRSGQF